MRTECGVDISNYTPDIFQMSSTIAIATVIVLEVMKLMMILSNLRSCIFVKDTR